eukprot:gb/GECG01016127.1/.p1 GENE.gb/GECG01016127.1/~~gb/GECG01016127.1/.p1  ORF type:complete len:806 (+),score=96.08 gb/GECG01016127.1/:1-2418(+)
MVSAKLKYGRLQVYTLDGSGLIIMLVLFSAEKVVDVLENVPGYREADSEDKWKAVCYQLFVKLDEILKEEYPQEGDRTGATAAVVVVTPTTIISASAGDSRAVLALKGEEDDHICLSADHKPTQDEETQRIENAGAAVLLGRVNGELAVSRAFGDFCYKTSKDLPLDQQAVTAAPYIYAHSRTGGEQAIIIACDGIWDVMDNKEVSDFVRHRLEKGRRDMKKLCASLVDTCLGEGSRDNMTAIIGAFRGYLAQLGFSDDESPPPSPCPHDFRDMGSQSPDSEDDEHDREPESPDDDAAANSPSDDEGEEYNGSYAKQESAGYRVQMNTTASDDEQVATLEEALRKSEEEEHWRELNENEMYDDSAKLGDVMRLNGSFRRKDDGEHHVSSVVSSTDSEGSRSSGGPDQHEEESSLWQNGGGNHVLTRSQRKSDEPDASQHLGSTVYSRYRHLAGAGEERSGGSNARHREVTSDDALAKSATERRRRAQERFLTRLQQSLNGDDGKGTYFSRTTRHVDSSELSHKCTPTDQLYRATDQPVKQQRKAGNTHVAVRTEGRDIDVTPSTHQHFYSPIPVVKVGNPSAKQATKNARPRSIPPTHRRPNSEKTTRIEAKPRPNKDSKQQRAISSTPRARSSRPRKRKSQPPQSDHKSTHANSSSRRTFTRDVDPVDPTWISRFLSDNTEGVERGTQTARPVPRFQASKNRQRVPNATIRKADNKPATRNPVRAGKGHENSNTQRVSRVAGRSKPSTEKTRRIRPTPQSANANADSLVSNTPASSIKKVPKRTKSRSKPTRRHQRVTVDDSML